MALPNLGTAWAEGDCPNPKLRGDCITRRGAARRRDNRGWPRGLTVRAGIQAVAWMLMLGLPWVACPLAHGDDQPPVDDQPLFRWTMRMFEELKAIEDAERRSRTASLVAAGLLDRGQVELARQVGQNWAQGDDQHTVLVLTTAVEASQLAVAGEDAKLHELVNAQSANRRQFVWRWVLHEAAQRGDIDQAVGLLTQLDDDWSRDSAASSIAEAYARAGQAEAAREWAGKIVDAERRTETLESLPKLTEPQPDPIADIRSPVLQAGLGALFAFGGTDRLEPAVRALAAAQQGDRMAWMQHRQQALAAIEAATPIEQTTGYTILATALVEAGEREAAREMIAKAHAAAGDEWLGVGSMFGDPVLIYLLCRLDRHDDIDALLANAARAGEDDLDRQAYHSQLTAYGSVLAELDQLPIAEKRIGRLASPEERCQFALGVVVGIPKP